MPEFYYFLRFQLWQPSLALCSLLSEKNTVSRRGSIGKQPDIPFACPGMSKPRKVLLIYTEPQGKMQVDRCSPCPLGWCKGTAYKVIVEQGNRNQCAPCPSTRTQSKAMTPLQHMLLINGDSWIHGKEWKKMKQQTRKRRLVLEREGSITEHRKNALALSPRSCQGAGKMQEASGQSTDYERPLVQQGERRSCAHLLLLSSIIKSSTLSIL